MNGNEPLSRFKGCPILVVGDLMLDEFIWGSVHRISPEAPVPVVQVQRRSFAPGGAANTAANVAALGGRPFAAGLVGDDLNGRRMVELLASLGVDATPLVKLGDHPTTTKTRVIAHSQQVVRIDEELPWSVTPEVEERLLGQIYEILPQVRGCVVSDYGKGVVTPRFIGKVVAAARERKIPLVVDPKGTDYTKYRGATLVKPNQSEAGKVLNRELHTSEEVDQAGMDLVELLGEETALLITRGAEGMSLFQRGKPAVHLPAQAREVYDVTGAGDTVASTLTTALAVGADLTTACRLAGLAAAVVVGKVGTAACSFEELKAAQQVVRW